MERRKRLHPAGRLYQAVEHLKENLHSRGKCSLRSKAILLHHPLHIALSKAKLNGRKLRLADEERQEICDLTIARSGEYGAWKDLDNALPVPIGHAMRNETSSRPRIPRRNETSSRTVAAE